MEKLASKMYSLIAIEALNSWGKLILYLANFGIYAMVITGTFILLWFDLTDNYNAISLVLTYTLFLTDVFI